MTITDQDTRPVPLPIWHNDMVTQNLHVIPPAPTRSLPATRTSRDRPRRARRYGGPSVRTVIMSLGYAAAAGGIVGIVIGLAAPRTYQAPSPLPTVTATEHAAIVHTPLPTYTPAARATVHAPIVPRVTTRRHSAVVTTQAQVTSPTAVPTSTAATKSASPSNAPSASGSTATITFTPVPWPTTPTVTPSRY